MEVQDWEICFWKQVSIWYTMLFAHRHHTKLCYNRGIYIIESPLPHVLHRHLPSWQNICFWYYTEINLLCLLCTQNALFVVHEKAWGGESSLSVCPGKENRPPSKKKMANPWGYAWAGGGVITQLFRRDSCTCQDVYSVEAQTNVFPQQRISII